MVRGGNPLHGDVTISGAKNAAVAILPACLLVNGKCRIENLPDIKDVKLFLKILENLGAEIIYIDKNTVEIDCTNVSSYEPLSDLTRKMRGSSYLMGALLGRFGKFRVDPPGGCDFGTRPIDMHIKCFELMGAEVDTSKGIVAAQTDHLKGANVFFDIVSVGATVNAILAAVLADGTTVIEGAAREPHVVDLANFLNACGAQIRGAGTDNIRIKGVPNLKGGNYAIIPDQIEAGTFMAAIAATKGDAIIKNVIPKHLESITKKMEKIGVNIEQYDDSIRVWVDGPLVKANVKTAPHPGFPTDMQSQIATLLTLAEGTSIITENIWDQRFGYVDELRRMGADITVNGKVALIEGTGKLMGAPVKACDLRAGAALIIAGLAASGVTEIEDIFHIERGYDCMEGKLRKLGAEIEKVSIPDSNVVEESDKAAI